MAEEKTEQKTKDVELKKSSDLEKVKATRALSPFEEMDHIAAHFFPHRWMRPFRTDWPSLPEMGGLFEGKIPKVDVIERDDEVLVRAEVPGVDKKDLDVSVTDNSVSISGSTSHEEKEEKGDYYRSEISRGSFSRVVALPSDVDSDKTTSKFKDGVLELTIPKVKKAKRKKIAIT